METATLAQDQTIKGLTEASDSTDTPPTMSPPTLPTIPPEVLDQIAFHTVLRAPLGPPHDLLSLMLVCKSIHASLCASSTLYSRIFRAQFDYAALRRRFSPAWLTSQVLADHLKARWTTLKRIRSVAKAWNQKSAEDSVWNPMIWATSRIGEDLWTAFFMLMENDGMNRSQLLLYANTRTYLEAYLSDIMVAKATKYDYQPENVTSALALWVGWLLTDQESVAKETVAQLEALIGLVRPFVFGAHRYDAYFAPWSLFDLPLPKTEETLEPPARYQYATFQAYMASDQHPRNNKQPVICLQRQRPMCAPMMALAAINSYFTRVEYHLKSRPAPAVATSNTGAGPAPHPGMAMAIPASQLPTVTAGSINYAALDSKAYDLDFHRLIACLNPYEPSLLPGQSFCPPGSMSGVWEGRFAFEEFDSFRDMLLGQRPPALIKVDGLLGGQQPQIWRIEEYHLYASAAGAYEPYPQSPVTEGRNATLTEGESKKRPPTIIEPLQTGPALNAHLPTASRFVPVPGGMEVSKDPNSPPLFYKKYVRPISSTGNDMMPTPKSLVRSHSPSSDTSDSESDADEESEEPVLDTLITGSGHSAWGPFTLRGRVRPWDGLVTVLKDYSSSDDPTDTTSSHDRGRWLYRGYVLAGGRNWVGRWRDTVTELEYCGYEGAFALHIRR